MPHILVIDDSEFDRRMVTKAMKAANENSTFAELERGEKALETIKDTNPDMVLLDIRMPGIGGFEVLRRIRSDRVVRDCKVVLISGSQAASDQDLAQKTGANAFYSKPHTVGDYERMAHDIYGRFL